MLQPMCIKGGGLNEYEHTQPGTLIRVMLSCGLTLACVAAFTPIVQNGQPEYPALIPAGILMLCLSLFHSLNVRVTCNDISISFGAGLIHKEFMIGDVENATIVRTRWYHGWGIKKIWGGWLYNVSGFDAVQLTMRDGKIVQIGTDEPKQLLAAIQEAMGHAVGLRAG